jgi:hypothetical protein
MKDLLAGYSRPSEEEFSQMWQECVFAFDANMLLNIYRYSPETQESFFIILERLKDRIWIPHQAAIEYFRNREEVIESQLKAYDAIGKLLDAAYENLGNQLAAYKRHLTVRTAPVLEAIQSGINKAKELLAADRQSHPDLSSSDPLRDKVVELFDGKVGSPFDNKRLSGIYSEAEQRFSVRKPPGYNDAKKPIPDRYGDVVLWFQLIEYAKAKRTPMILVTDDRKEDWWLKKQGQTVSPQPDLINEIQGEAGIKFYMYQSDQFIKYAQGFLAIEDQQAAVQEVEDFRKGDEEYQNEIDYLISHDLINPRILETARPLDSLLVRQAVDAARLYGNSQAHRLIENAIAFQSPHMRRAAEAAAFLDTSLARRVAEAARWQYSPGIRQAIEDASSLNNSHIRRAAEAATSRYTPGIRHAIEAANSLNNLHTRRATEDAGYFNNSTMGQAIEAANRWRRNPLSGQSISQDIFVEITPKRLSDLQDGADTEDVKVEVLTNTEPDASPEEESVEDVGYPEEEGTETLPYEFDNYPITVTLVHGANSSQSFETGHRLRKPTFDEWEVWGLDLERTRRYLSPDEVAEHNEHKGEDEEDTKEIYEHFYGEWQASKKLYNKIILEVAGVKLNKDDDFPADKFRELPSEIIDKLWFETKTSVITKLYECYCSLEKPASSGGLGRRVFQKIYDNSTSFRVIHVLREPTEEESRAFRTTIVKGGFSTDEDGQEIIQLKLNLPAAAEFYKKLILNVENATVGGQPFSDETRDAFLEAINPVYKLRVLEPLFDVNAWYFKMDDLRFP